MVMATQTSRTEDSRALLSVREVEIETVESPDLLELNELASQYHCICSFCEKEIILESYHASMYEKMVKSQDFHCANCIRSDFNTKRKRDILVLTFRAIFGYIYYREYAKPYADRTIYLAELQDFIDAHVKVGLLNPAFSYDPDNYLWFADFSKIGSGKRQLQLEEIYKTIVNILACFNLFDSVPNVQMHKIYDKYNEAINLFYEKRQRPEGKRLLVPTLSACGGNVKTMF